MQVARIIGHATATVKHVSLKGWRLLIAQPLLADRTADGEPLIVIDELGCGTGDDVVLTSDGATVRKMMNTNKSPVRWAVMGIVDE